MEKATRSKIKQSVSELKDGLLKLGNPSYNNIDKLMRGISHKYSITLKDLHYGFRDLNDNKTPDDWIKKNKKMKTFKEFLEEVHLIQEMRKEDKVRGKTKTPMYVDKVKKTVEKTPEGNWRINKTTYRKPNQVAVAGRLRQGLSPTPDTPPVADYAPTGGRMHSAAEMHPHGQGGSKRGVKKQKGKKPGKTIEKTPRGRWKVMHPNTGPTPAERLARKKAKSQPYQGFDYKKYNF